MLRVLQKSQMCLTILIICWTEKKIARKIIGLSTSVAKRVRNMEVDLLNINHV